MFESSLKCRCSQSSIANTAAKGLPRSSRFFIPEAKPQYAPDRLVDVEQIKLELAVDLPAKALKGTCTTAFRGVAPATGKLTFDALDLVIEKVTDAEGRGLQFDRQPEKLVVFLKKAIRPEEHGQIAIHYRVTEPRAGLYFIAPDKDYPNRPWQLWTQGQDQDNRYWIPCHDFPNEKAATEMIVTVDARYTAISNGKLVSETSDRPAKTRTFHWKQSIPHASYLITLCVGEFSEIRDAWKDSKGNEIPVVYYTIPGREPETKLAFGKTPGMLDFFSRKIGIDYPYEKYAQVVAWDFIYGGMENTSSTTQTEYTLHPESVELDYSSEPLVAHELAHQWFGDLLTCKEWSHAWLNEGFATYFEALWMEHEHGTEEFLYELWLNEKTYKKEDSGAYRRPLVTNVFMSPSDIFDRHLYEKGGRILHMLRNLVGDELWWKSIQRYVTAHYAKTVETVDLQRAFEETTGHALSWFFDQWSFRAGHPEIKASYEWDEEKKTAKFTLNQAQKADDLVGIFRFPLKIKIATADGEYIHDVEIDAAEKSFSFACGEKPKFVSLNVENTILADWDFKPARGLLTEQLKRDKDVMGRVFAARALGKDHSRESVDALGEALGGDKETEKFWGVQAEICEALASIGSPRAQEYLLGAWQKLKHPRARKAALKAIGAFRNGAAFEAAEQALKSDNSPLCQYEAGAAIGRARVPNVYEKLTAALGKRESWHDYYDRGILAGLSELHQDERVFGVLTKYLRAGVSIFTRREAVDALLRYGSARPSLIVEPLAELTRDQNFFVRLMAIEALAMLGDSRATAAIQRVVDCVVDPRTKRAAVLALKSIREGANANENVVKLREDFDRLREQYRELLGRVEKIEPTAKAEKPVGV